MMNHKSYFICGFALLFVSATHGGYRNISEILGSTHMNPLYNFTTAPVMQEGADVLRHMGSGTIKFWYGPDYATNYPQNHSWPVVSNLMELAQTSYFETMFGDPDFTTYSLQAATFNYRNGWQYGDFSSVESNSISAEVYDLATYLLTNYNDSGKTFIIQNWEGDNALGQDAPAQKVQSMIDWLNCRQDAIHAAVADSTSSNVWVYGAAECNKVGQINFSGPRCYTDVFPYLHMDLYSYSNYHTREDEAKLLEDMNNIKRFAPDSAAFGHENVMLGEFGLNRMNTSEAENYLISRTVSEIGVDVGARFAFYWQVYGQTDTNQSHGLVLNADRAGLFGLPVDHTGRYFSQTHDYFKTNSLTLDIYEDFADDFSNCDSYSNLKIETLLKDQLDNDPGRFVRMDGNEQGKLEYSFDRDVRRLAIMGYEDEGENNQIFVYASKTGAAGSYTNIPISRILNSVYAGNIYRRVLNKNVNVIPPGYRYFNIILNSNVQWSPQISSLRFYYERPPTVQTIQFGGLVAHLSDTNHQAQVGADELVQFNGSDSWGGGTGFNGNLNNGAVGTFIASPATGLKLSTTFATSNTAINGSTGVIGIMGGDNAKFDPGLAEQWSLEFNQPVVLKQLLLAAVNGDAEEVSIEINGVPSFFTRAHPNSEPSGWDVNRFIYTFDPPVELTAGTDLTIGALTTGQFGLEGVVVQAGALASPYHLWANTKGLAGADADWFADPDGNGMNNQLDYALGGVKPTSALTQAGGTNTIQMVYRRRRDAGARGLDYQTMWTDNLVSNVWSAAGALETGAETIDESFETVTNHIPVDLPSSFIRLEIDRAE